MYGSLLKGEVEGHIKARIFFFLLLMFVLSAFNSCKELKYSLGSKTTEATVIKITEAENRRNQHIGYYVSFDFRNENTGKVMTGSTLCGDYAHEQYPVKTKINIEYYGEKNYDARICGASNSRSVKIFFLILAVMAGFVVWMVLTNPKLSKK